MAEFQKLDNELVIATLNSTNGSILLTNFRVFQYTGKKGSQQSSSIIPIDNIDSFGLIKAESKWLLWIGILSGVLGALSLFLSNEPAIGVGLVITCVFFIISWQASKKTGIAIYSFSGKTEIFLETTGKNQNDLLDFIQKIQNWLFLKKSANSNTAS